MTIVYCKLEIKSWRLAHTWKRGRRHYIFCPQIFYLNGHDKNKFKIFCNDYERNLLLCSTLQFSNCFHIYCHYPHYLVNISRAEILIHSCCHLQASQVPWVPSHKFLGYQLYPGSPFLINVVPNSIKLSLINF